MIIDREREQRFIEQEIAKPEAAFESPQAIERDYNVYERFFDETPESLAGLNVLNIGCGLQGIFDKEAAKAGANVISLSPHFADQGLGGERFRANYTPPLYMRNQFAKRICSLLGCAARFPKYVAGVAEDLPINDGTIDRALALYSVPLYTNDLEKMLLELGRVLKDDGVAKLFPVCGEDRGKMEAIAAANPGLVVEFVEMPELSVQNGVYHGEVTYLALVKKR